MIGNLYFAVIIVTVIFLTVINEFFQQFIRWGYDRNAEEHTGNAHKGAADGDRRKHPNTGQTDRWADYLRRDEISLYRLQNDDEN